MPDFRKELFEFVLDKAESEPAAKKAVLYRALAEYCGDEKQAANFRVVALSLERAESMCRQFVFDFKKPA